MQIHFKLIVNRLYESYIGCFSPFKKEQNNGMTIAYLGLSRHPYSLSSQLAH